MTKYIIIRCLMAVFSMLAVISIPAQKQFIHIATKANNYCNSTCTLLDILELNNNPTAILLVMPVKEKNLTENNHPIGVYYINKKWRIFNADQTTITEGSKFNVIYYENADANRFVHVVTPENWQTDGTFIDHPALNNNPDAKFEFSQNWNPS